MVILYRLSIYLLNYNYSYLAIEGQIFFPYHPVLIYNIPINNHPIYYRVIVYGEDVPEPGP